MGILLLHLSENFSAKNLLRAELVKRDISNQRLTELLQERGISITRAAVDNRLSRGSFSADFFVDCLRVIGCHDVSVLGDKHDL